MRGASPVLPIVVAVGLLGLVIWGWQRGRSKEAVETPKTLTEIYLGEQRIRTLLVDCGIGRTFEGDTTDLVDVMVGKLADGQVDVLHRNKALLAGRKEEAIPALTRLFEKAYSEQWGSPVMQNVLGVCAMMESNAGLELARNGFAHSREDIRLASLDILSQFGEPSDYEDIKGWIPIVANQPTVLDYLRAMAHCDLDQFSKDALEWMEGGVYPGIWFHMAPELMDVTDKSIARRMLAVAIKEGTPGPAVAALLVAPARLDIEGARDALTARLTSDVDQRVLLALTALERAGLHHLASGVLVHSKNASLRERAATILAKGEHSEEIAVWLNEGLSDSERIVRMACLGGLLKRKDPEAVARVVLNLTKGPVDRDGAFQVLEGNWDADPELPRRVFEVLRAEYEASTTREGWLSILKVIGRVPIEDSARFLLEHHSDLTGTVAGLRPHRWVAGHAFNAGEAGMRVLHEAIGTEEDPLRRLDLIGMIWQDKSAASREVLKGILLDPERNEFERLFVADRLTLISDPEDLAPIVKRFYFDSTHFHVRPALQCLLWRWYGLPNA